MLALTTMTKEGLAQLNALSDGEKSRLESLESILERLIRISRDKLEGKELSEADYEFIRNFGQQLDSVGASMLAPTRKYATSFKGVWRTLSTPLASSRSKA